MTACDDQITLNFMPVGPGPLLVIPGSSSLVWNQHHYRGGFLISAKNNHLILINFISLEDYLRGVVPREVMASWPLAALKAQAIAARTYAIASLGRHGSDNFDLCPTDHCQVYGGIDSEKASTDIAVTSTAGEIITYRGKVISAVYHSSSGGSTFDAANVWNFSVPYLKSAIDWDQNSPYNQWTRYLNWNELQGLVSHYYPLIGRLQRVSDIVSASDGQLLRITLQGDLGENTINGDQFRALAGLPSVRVQIGVIYGPAPFVNLWWSPGSPYPEALMADNAISGLVADVLTPPWDLPDPWSWLEDKEPIRMVLRGSGWGHGVGLSQWGARGMADAGYNESQILEHYYPGATITDIGNIHMDGSKNNAGQ
ncbi:MAG TPA: hypothetical protein DDW50_17190 [Firmicutes bacterium]|nr:hypothetical protein [Bacillota bacterium]